MPDVQLVTKVGHGIGREIEQQELQLRFRLRNRCM